MIYSSFIALGVILVICALGMLYLSFGYSKKVAGKHYDPVAFWLNLVLAVFLAVAAISYNYGLVNDLILIAKM